MHITLENVTKKIKLNIRQKYIFYNNLKFKKHINGIP